MPFFKPIRYLCISFVLLAAALPLIWSSDMSRAALFFKESRDPREFQCLTGAVPDDEALLRHDLLMRAMKNTGRTAVPAKTIEAGNIVVIEDDGTTVFPENPLNV